MLNYPIVSHSKEVLQLVSLVNEMWQCMHCVGSERSSQKRTNRNAFICLNDFRHLLLTIVAFIYRQQFLREKKKSSSFLRTLNLFFFFLFSKFFIYHYYMAQISDSLNSNMHKISIHIQPTTQQHNCNCEVLSVFVYE